jgi:hypothetical protein
MPPTCVTAAYGPPQHMAPRGIWPTAECMLTLEGFRAYYRGIVPSMVGALRPAHPP